AVLGDPVEHRREAVDASAVAVDLAAEGDSLDEPSRAGPRDLAVVEHERLEHLLPGRRAEEAAVIHRGAPIRHVVDAGDEGACRVRLRHADGRRPFERLRAPALVAFDPLAAITLVSLVRRGLHSQRLEYARGHEFGIRLAADLLDDRTQQ